MILLPRSAAAATLAAALLLSFGAAARNPLTSLHPEEFHPDNATPLATPDGEYAPFIKRVQERLRQLGFDAGPVNGDFGAKTQAALAQFQLANVLPASGQLDDATLRELDVQRPAESPAATTTQQ